MIAPNRRPSRGDRMLFWLGVSVAVVAAAVLVAAGAARQRQLIAECDAGRASSCVLLAPARR